MVTALSHQCHIFLPRKFWKGVAPFCILREIQHLSANKKPWFINYYLIIIIVGVMLALFIWFLFRMSLSELDNKSKETIPKKETVN